MSLIKGLVVLVPGDIRCGFALCWTPHLYGTSCWLREHDSIRLFPRSPLWWSVSYKIEKLLIFMDFIINIYYWVSHGRWQVKDVLNVRSLVASSPGPNVKSALSH